jgi:hypothetical protein
MESRYLNRFRSLGEKTGSQIKDQDSAGNLTERLTHAKGSISAQQQNIAELFGTAQEMITGINTHQQMIGVEMVRNIPLPTDKIKAQPSNQLGYVQLSLRFLQAGVLHFMEEMYNAQGRIQNLEDTISKLAAYDMEVDVIGRMNAIDIDSLELLDNHSLPNLPPTPPESVTSPIPADTTADTKPQIPGKHSLKQVAKKVVLQNK